MTLNFAAPMLTLNGKSMTQDGQPVTETNPAITLGTVAINALLANLPDEQNLSGVEKLRRFRLAQKLHEKAQVNLTPEDITLIKTLVAKTHSILVTGQVFEILNGDGEDETN